MYVAGDPSLALVAADLPRRLAVGGRRRRGQPLVRPRHRRADGAHGRRGRCRPGGSRRGAALAFGIVLARAVVRPAVADRQRAERRRWRCAGFLGYVFVYTMWLKRSTPQNIVIGGAAGAVPPLVGWAAVTGHARPDRAVPVRDRLLLDAAALLGAVAADEGRVRARRRADDAGRPRRGRDAPPDPALHRACSSC